MSEPVVASEQDPGPAEERTCGDCGAACPGTLKFCGSCGALQRPPRSALDRPERADHGATDGPACRVCGAATDEGARFCRQCGQVQAERAPLVAQRESGSLGGGQQRGVCHGCRTPLEQGRLFCPSCGTASRLARVSRSELMVHDPSWYRVVRGLGLVWEGHVTLIVAAVAATAVVTVLSLFGVSWGKLEMVRAGLLGAAALAAVVGIVLGVIGEVFCLAAPRESRTRVPALVTLGIGAASALLIVITLAWMGAVGFDPGRIPSAALTLGAVALLLFVARLLAFSTLLRHMAFALQHYRIAQGSVGFMIFIGVGLAVVGLINLLFQSARPSVQTFAQLLAVAFALLVIFWYLNMVRRGRDLVRQRLP
ncbi:MAG: zinc ribbon domain-containing protein [bacterium]